MKITHAVFTAVFAMAVTVSARPAIDSACPDIVGEYTPSTEDYESEQPELARRGGSRVSVKSKYFPWSPAVGGPNPEDENTDLEKRGGSRVSVKSKYFPWSPAVGGPNVENFPVEGDDEADGEEEEEQFEKRGGSRVSVKSKYFPWSPAVGGPQVDAAVDDADTDE